jgi:hypothetical protein
MSKNLSSILASNLPISAAGGQTGQLLVQSAPNITTSLPKGAVGQVLTAAGNGTAPTWSVLKINNIVGGIASQIPYQSAAGTTAFIPNGTSGQVLTSNGTAAPSWSATAVSVAQVATPSNVSPTNALTGLGPAPVLTASAYYNLYGYTMTAAQWQVSTDSTFATTLVSSGDVAGTAVSYTISATLVISTTYFWRVRYKDSTGTYSAWSTPTSFTTDASFGPTAVGQSYGGGYYAGKITDGGVGYYIIVAPKATGENTSLAWKTTNTAGPTGVQTLTNGPASTLAMFNAGSALYPAATYCHNLSIGGFTDWYLPARDELEVVYRAFKPTTYANSTVGRPSTGFGGDGLVYGTNANSIPAGAAYTAGSPAQTAVAKYITVSGTEAFYATGYWSSTELAATGAWYQFNTNGSQNDSSKAYARYVRAVRRLVI